MILDLTITENMFKEIRAHKKCTINVQTKENPDPIDYLRIKNPVDEKEQILVVDCIYEFENEKRISFHIPKVGVILPTYNSEKYITETLESILNQSFRDFELIVVSDYYPDETASIISAFKKSMPITVQTTGERLGLAKSRNKGLRWSANEYVCFIDSDDLFDEDYLMELYSAVSFFGADLSLAEYDSFVSEKGYVLSGISYFRDPIIVDFHKRVFLWEEFPGYLRHLVNVTWNKMFRRKFLIDNMIEFQDISSSEDVYCSHMAMISGNMIHVNSDKALVHYRTFRKGNLTSTATIENEIAAYLKIRSECLSRFNKDVDKNVKQDMLYGLFKFLRKSKSDEKQNVYSIIRKFIYDNDALFSSEFMEEHKFLKELLKNSLMDCEWSDAKFQVVELLHDKKEEIYDLIKKYDGHKLGFLKCGANETYFMKFCVDMGIGIRWHDSSQWENENIEAVVCLSPLQLFDISTALEKTAPNKPGILAIYTMENQ